MVPLAVTLRVPGGEALLAGSQTHEALPPLAFKNCVSVAGRPGCVDEPLRVTLDSQYRWVHEAKEGSYTNCFVGTDFNKAVCPNASACAQQCAIDGVSLQQYTEKYGVGFIERGVELRFGTPVEGGGMNFGSRVLVTTPDGQYKVFRLKNREFTFDVDLSSTPCGLNAAVYFVGMDPSGDAGADQAGAGSKYGLGYCDAQCPRNLKWLGGEANMDWDVVAQQGRRGNCCPEFDILEANRNASAFTLHPCETLGPERCVGDACGSTCDGIGCQFHAYSLGAHDYFGPKLDVDTTQPMTVVTQFITNDGSDHGDLSEIKRFYLQNGKVILNPDAVVPDFPDMQGRSIKEGMCASQHGAQLAAGLNMDQRHYAPKMGEYMKKMGEAMDHGMSLVLSLWDSPSDNMAWLDSPTGFGQAPERHSSNKLHMKGPCFGEPLNVRKDHAGATVRYSNFRFGELGTTCPTCPGSLIQQLDTSTPAPSPWKAATTAQTTSTTSKRPLPQLTLFHSPAFLGACAVTGVGLLLYAVYLDLRARGWEFSMPSARQPFVGEVVTEAPSTYYGPATNE